jgi:SNF2 family DNA or RNA helicase
MIAEIKNGKVYIDHDAVIKFGLAKFKNYFKFVKMKSMKWEITATYPNVEAVNKIFKTKLAIEEKKDTTDVTKFLMDSKHEFKLEPFKHQLEALTKCGSREFYAYFMEPGLGKSKTVIDDAVILYEGGKVDTVLVVCPISAMSVWKREIANNSNAVISCWPDDPTNDRNLRFYIINHDALVSKAVNRTKTIKKLEETKDKKEIKKLTDKVKKIEGNETDGFSVASKFLMSSSRCMMVIDESSVICNWKSLRTEYCTKLGEMTQYRRILTGSPITNNPIDLYSQLYWLDPTTVRNRSYYAFRNHFCDLGGFKGKQIVGYKNLGELINICKQHGCRIKSEDALTLPKQNWLIREVTLGKDARNLYDKIVEEDIVPLLDDYGNESVINTALILTQMIKLRQVCGGTLIDDDKKAHIVGTEKLDELLITLDEWNGIDNVIIWHQWSAEGKMIEEALKKRKKSAVLFNGSVPSNERGKMISDFEDGKTNYLLVQNDTGYSSITLNKASYSIIYSNPLRPLIREQLEKRNHRIGQLKPVFYFDLLVKNTIDEWIYKRLKKKLTFNASIIDAGLTKSEIMNAVYGKE